MNTEITDNNVESLKSWVLYDGSCSLCSASARFFGPILSRHGFALAPLQTPWVRERLGRREDEPPVEMRLLLANGDAPGEADAIIEIARRIWWGWPLFIIAELPRIRHFLRVAYRVIAANRHCANGACNFRGTLRWYDWLPLIVLPTIIVAMQNRMAPWVFMWSLAASIFLGCKWLTYRRAIWSISRPTVRRSLAYFLAWPGMDAMEFLREQSFGRGKASKWKWLFAAAKGLLGAALVLTAARDLARTGPLLTGWIGMLGIILFLHFGVFDLVALAWQTAGVNAKPVMRAPIIATSLAEFWSMRWNTAFNGLAHDLAFRPLARRIGVTRATFSVFLISGIVHDLVISLPARGGYGFPTAYFLVQALAVLAERTEVGRSIGLGKGFRGWLYMATCAAGSAFWLFHPPFVVNVILPMLHAIVAT